MKKVYIKFNQSKDLSTVKVIGAPKGFRDKLLIGLGSIPSIVDWSKHQTIHEVLGICRSTLSCMKVEAFRIEYFYQSVSWCEKVVREKLDF